MIETIERTVGSKVAQHLQRRWFTTVEQQVQLANGIKIRIPKDGTNDPYYFDGSEPNEKITHIGVSGWDYEDKRSVYVVIDLDGLNHESTGHSDEHLATLVDRLTKVEEAEITRSKSGKGYHVTLYFDVDDRPRADIRDRHISNSYRALAWLCKEIGEDYPLHDTSDAVGVIAWILHPDTAENGFELIKSATKALPSEWRNTMPQVSTAGEPVVENEMPTLASHEKLIDYLTKKGFAEWDGKRLTTHTYHLATAAQEKELKIAPGFATLASGKSGAADRNCFMFPDADGAWRVFRFTKRTKEHESWWISANGWTTCWYNRREVKGTNPATKLVALAKQDYLFHDPSGRAFVSTTLHGISETMTVADPRYRAKLRIEYTSRGGWVAATKDVNTAIDHLTAMAVDGPEHTVAIRVAEQGALFIDLANRKRQIVKVTGTGWEIVDDCPIRFFRPAGMLPLPTPERGGKLDDLRPFINVDPEDLPLLLAFVVGCFHPTGPYALLQLCGEQGTAKSSLQRLIHDIVDPQIGVGATLPKDSKDLLVTAQFRRLVSFDNVDALDRKTSSLLCMLVTGAASAVRQLYSNDQQSVLTAKRPCILTSITNVVTAGDLLDRTLTLILPPIPPENRRSEFAIEQELRKDGVRGRIFGYILDGVVAAIANHASIKRDDMPRLADLFSWATAAERGLGLKDGAVIDSQKRQSNEQSEHVKDDPFAATIIRMCGEAWKGTPAELANAVNITLPDKLSARKIGSTLRQYAPDLRRLGYVIDYGKNNGVRYITLGKREAV